MSRSRCELFLFADPVIDCHVDFNPDCGTVCPTGSDTLPIVAIANKRSYFFEGGWVSMSGESSQLATWLTRARQGDEIARNQLFEACRSFVALMSRVQLHRRLQGKIDPSDLVQQSLLEAHQGFSRFAGQTPEEWFAWLKHIVQYNVLDADKHYRGAARRDLRLERRMSFENSSHQLSAWSPADPGPSPSQLLSNAERELRLAAAMEDLPDDYREVVLLRNIERLSFDQVALRMDRSRGACQMLWMRAMEQLRNQLNRESVF